MIVADTVDCFKQALKTLVCKLLFSMPRTRDVQMYRTCHEERGDTLMSRGFVADRKEGSWQRA